MSSFDFLSLSILDKQAEDQPKSPGVTGNVDLITLDMPRRDVEKPVEGSAVMAREILGCHTTLVVSSFFVLECFLLSCRVICLDLALLAESGQSNRGAGRVPSAGWRRSPVDS